MCIRAEGGIILWKESLGTLLSYLGRQAESDKRTRKEQRGRAAAKNVSAKVAFRFHKYISLLRREPRVAVDPAGRGSGGALGETPNGLSASASLPKIPTVCQ